MNFWNIESQFKILVLNIVLSEVYQGFVKFETWKFYNVSQLEKFLFHSYLRIEPDAGGGRTPVAANCIITNYMTIQSEMYLRASFYGIYKSTTKTSAH